MQRQVPRWPVRVGTFNAQFLPFMMSCRSRAQVLADGIIRSDYDILALNEVFSGRARRALIQRLSRDFPYIVERISDRNPPRLDSGLMLFSRLPFDDLTDIAETCSAQIKASAAGVTTVNAVRFDEFLDHVGSDGLATKGTAYVRVRIDGRPLHVFLTHVQASYLSHSTKRYLRTVDVRALQMAQMAGFMKKILGDRSGNDNVIVLGDLNVHWSAAGAGYPHEGANQHRDESEMMFEAFNPVFDGNLVDLWRQNAPARDPGLTFPSTKPRSRPDYILMSVADPAQPLCAQQVSVERSLGDSRGLEPHELSDHMGLKVDLNQTSPRGSLPDAEPLSLDGRPSVQDGRIAGPGGSQWYLLDGCGRFEFAVTGEVSGTEQHITVYADSDISQPLEPVAVPHAAPSVSAYELTSVSYLRVGNPRSSDSGAFTLRVTPIVV